MQHKQAEKIKMDNEKACTECPEGKQKVEEKEEAKASAFEGNLSTSHFI